MAKAAGVTGPDLAGLMVNISKAIGAGSKATVSTAALSAKRIHERRKGFVGPASAGQFTGGRNAAVNIPGVGFRRSARHPGTTGQHPWRKGATKAAPVIRKTMSSRTASIVKKAAKP